MKVVNLRKDKYTVYIGRSGKGLSGYWGNPVKMNEPCFICGNIHTSRGSTLFCYEQYLRNRLQNSMSFRQMFMELNKDDVLGCFCKPDECHGDVMIKVWKELNDENSKKDS